MHRAGAKTGAEVAGVDRTEAEAEDQGTLFL